VRERLFAGERKRYPRDASSPAVIRDPEKCVLCGRCVRVCEEVQGVRQSLAAAPGFANVVAPAHDGAMAESVCIQCGQCINVCPTAAFVEADSTDEVLDALADPEKHVVVQTAPSIRAAVGEGFGFAPGTPATGKLVTACRLMGFARVFDTNLGADLTIVEESAEFLARLKTGERLPLITSCSPGWINFMERFYPDVIPNASTCKSPMSMLSTLIKTYYAEKAGLDPKSIYVVAVMRARRRSTRPGGRSTGAVGRALHRRGAHYARVHLAGPMPGRQLPPPARWRVRFAAGRLLGRGRHLRGHGRRDGGGAPDRL